MGSVIYRWTLPPKIAGHGKDAVACLTVEEEGTGWRECDDLEDILSSRLILSLFCPACANEWHDVDSIDLDGGQGDFQANFRNIVIFHWSSFPENPSEWTTAPYSGIEIYCPAGHMLHKRGGDDFVPDSHRPDQALADEDFRAASNHFSQAEFGISSRFAWLHRFANPLFTARHRALGRRSLERAAAGGHASAQFELSTLIAANDRLDPRSLSLLRKSAEQGLPEAVQALEERLRRGEPVIENARKAKTYIEKLKRQRRYTEIKTFREISLR